MGRKEKNEIEQPVHTSEYASLYLLQRMLFISALTATVLSVAIYVAIAAGSRSEAEITQMHSFQLSDEYTNGVLVPIVDHTTLLITDTRTGVVLVEKLLD